MKVPTRAALLLLVIPAFVYLVDLAVPLVNVVRISFFEFSRLTGMREAVTLAQYEQVLGDPYYRTIWVNTIRIGLEVGAITTVFGAFVAYGLWRATGRWRAYLTFIVVSPLLISSTVRAFGWLVTTGPGGLLPTVTSGLGFGRLILVYNEASVVVALVHVLLPYAVILILANLDGIDESMLKAAADLGAGWIRTLARVLFPLITPGLATAFIFTFIGAATSYAIPAVLGGRRLLIASLSIVEDQLLLLDWPRAAAQSVVLVALTLTVVIAYELVTRVLGRRSVIRVAPNVG